MTLINILILIGFMYFIKFYHSKYPSAGASYKGMRYSLKASLRKSPNYFIFSLSAAPEKKAAAPLAAAPDAEITITEKGKHIGRIFTDPSLGRVSEDKRTLYSYAIWKLNNERGEIVLPGTYEAEAALAGDTEAPHLKLSFNVGL